MTEILYTPAEAIEAIEARINGVWSNEQLVKLGPLDLITDDIILIIAATERP